MQILCDYITNHMKSHLHSQLPDQKPLVCIQGWKTEEILALMKRLDILPQNMVMCHRITTYLKTMGNILIESNDQCIQRTRRTKATVEIKQHTGTSWLQLT